MSKKEINTDKLNSKEDIQKYVTEKCNGSRLFEEIILESSKYPCAILIRNGGNNKGKAMSNKQYKTFLLQSKEVLVQKHFAHLYKQEGTPKYRKHGGGFLIPVEKSLEVETIIHSLNQINLQNNLGLQIEKSRDGPCEDGRNIGTEWKLLPPDITIENVETYLSDFGVVKSKKEADESLFVTFSNIFDILPLCSMLNPHLNSGSKWFHVFKDRPTLCRFVSSISCSNCSLQGHHHSRCPDGLAEVTKLYRKLSLGLKATNPLINNNQNHTDTTNSAKSSKKSVKLRPFNDKTAGQKKQKSTDNSSKGESKVSLSPIGKAKDSKPSSLSLLGRGSNLELNPMDTSLDFIQDPGLTEKLDIAISDSKILSVKPTVSAGVEVKSFANVKKKKKKKSK